MTVGLQRPPVGAPAPPPARPPKGVRLSRIDQRWSPYLYIAPFFLLFGVFGLYPLGYTLWVSLHDWDLLGTEHTFVGLENYSRLMADSDFWHSVVNTLGIFVISTVPQLLAALWLANLLNRQLRARTTFRMAVLVPNVTSTAAVAIVFGVIFGREFGMVNWLLDLVGVDPIGWKSNRFASWVAISTMVDWRWTGYNALIFLAAMQAIPRDLYESAAIDGANRVRQFWSITVPLLKPTIIFTVIISTIGGLQLFTEPRLFHSGTNPIRGGPMRESQTVTMYMFENAFAPHYNFGYGSAVAWLLFALIAVVAAINVLMLRRLAGGGPKKADGGGPKKADGGGKKEGGR
ncbi:carbohydrate ABC transporter permease [Micromonospora inyonensis]|uniref:Cellobiose transport system permease protein n=1 Tax=Micromonospora inyonensis TaxID=47866 RepID=A0A1C6RBD4_9ACTN|nr:sugar ABC transporter permease [Micromonospora inyonensis]SCL14364.1 cellobiose transport system permease protein [Micromonospora inyonensis]